VAAAVNWAINNVGTPVQSNFPNDYQQFFLTNIIAQPGNRTLLAPLTGSVTPAQMVIATEIIRAAGETFLTGATGIQAIGGLTKDVFFCSGIFINVDDSYLPYITITSFKKWTVAGGWVDITSAFNSTV
jgi:hypothetical protein